MLLSGEIFGPVLANTRGVVGDEARHAVDRLNRWTKSWTEKQPLGKRNGDLVGRMESQYKSIERLVEGADVKIADLDSAVAQLQHLEGQLDAVDGGFKLLTALSDGVRDAVAALKSAWPRRTLSASAHDQAFLDRTTQLATR